MKLQTLQLAVSEDHIEFNLVGDRAYRGGEVSLATDLAKQLDDLEYAGTDQRLALLQQHTDALVPAEFGTWYRDWSNVDEEAFLCIHTTVPQLSSLPWNELIVRRDVPPTRNGTVRVCNLTGSCAAPLPQFIEVLFAGWAELSAGPPMVGIQRELTQFREKLGSERLKSRVLTDPPCSDFLLACRNSQASIVHLSPPSLIRDGSFLAIPVTPDADKRQQDAPTFEQIGLNTLVDTLRHNDRLRLMVVNACGSGLLGCETISRDLGVITLGWPALVRDDTAADFTFYFYARLLEGFTPATAVRSFAQAVWSRQALHEFPVVWYPSPEWVTWAPLKEVRAPTSQPVESLPPIPSPVYKSSRAVPTKEADSINALVLRPPNIQLEFRPRTAINPALLVNGLQPIEHLTIETSGEITVHLCIVCDTGGGLSSYRQTVPLKKGTNPVRVEEIHFPALNELIDRHAHRRRVNFTATIFDLNKNELFGETRTAIWMGATEWLDQEETWAFVPAFVNPFNEGVLKVFGEATKVLRTLGVRHQRL
jgi:hypothetical protein